MGTAVARVVGSGDWPACSWRVSKCFESAIVSSFGDVQRVEEEREDASSSLFILSLPAQPKGSKDRAPRQWRAVNVVETASKRYIACSGWALPGVSRINASKTDRSCIHPPRRFCPPSLHHPVYPGGVQSGERVYKNGERSDMLHGVWRCHNVRMHWGRS